MSWLSDRVDELGAESLEQTAAPESPVGWGSDLSCDHDIDEAFTELAGDDPILVAQAAYRAITTPRGSVPDAPDYGVDLNGYLSRGVTVQAIQALAGMISLEIRKDDRVDSVSVDVQPEDDGRALRVTIDGTIAESSRTFSLVLGLTDAGVLLEEMKA